MTEQPRKPLFERLKTGLEDGIAHARGELLLKTVEVPDDTPVPEADRPATEPSGHVSPKSA